MKSLTAILVLCFAIVACGCKAKIREGEIFVVLKSDEVKPLADIEVIGFDKSFGERFAEWQSKWNNIKPIPFSTEWQNKLNKLNRLIETTCAVTNPTSLELRARSDGNYADNIPLGMKKIRDHILAEISKLEQLKKEQTLLAEQEMKSRVLAPVSAECAKSFAVFLSNNAVYSTRTGSKGEFQIPGKVAFVFAGKVRPTTGETPCWLVKVDYQQKTIRLSNSNLTAKDDSDELWMLRYTP